MNNMALVRSTLVYCQRWRSLLLCPLVSYGFINHQSKISLDINGIVAKDHITLAQHRFHQIVKNSKKW
jgi:hypothetical protein